MSLSILAKSYLGEVLAGQFGDLLVGPVLDGGVELVLEVVLDLYEVDELARAVVMLLQPDVGTGNRGMYRLVEVPAVPHAHHLPEQYAVAFLYEDLGPLRPGVLGGEEKM